MKKNNVKCIICGKEYHYCHTCKDKNDPSWKMSFCSDNCRRIYNTAVAFNMQKITKEQALQELNNEDLSKINNFTDATKRIINKIKHIDKKEENTMTIKMNAQVQAQDVVVTPKKSIKNFKKR